jgi:2-polyprenyl-3-methyl-5-hydroxy-6-metoxy-1,4-benzoquinol methylase
MKKRCVLCKGKKFTILFPHHNGWVMGKCMACGLVQLVPMPTEEEIAALYHEDSDHFEPYIAQKAVHQAYFRGKVKEMLMHFRGVPITHGRLRLLDIGCLTGVLLSEGKKAGMKVTGVDISRDAVLYCRKKGFTVYAGTVQSLGKKLKFSLFDIVSAFQIIEHERDPLVMMKRIHKLLKKGGVVVLATPNQGGMWSKRMGRRWFGFAHPEHVVLFDFKTMRTLLEKAGFKDIEVTADSPRPFPLSFAFTRGADYFPWMAWLLKPIGKLLDHFHLKNPVNPWDDMIAFGRK